MAVVSKRGDAQSVNVKSTYEPDNLRCPCCGQSLGIAVIPPDGAWRPDHDGTLLVMRRRGVPWKLIARMLGKEAITCRFRFYQLFAAPGPVDR